MELIDAERSYENFKLMGDALMKIHEPEDAAKAYEEALKLKPDDDQIIRQLGACLTKTYDYNRAIKYYE
jgi:tetratricopeptide repeat protein 21B